MARSLRNAHSPKTRRGASSARIRSRAEGADRTAHPHVKDQGVVCDVEQNLTMLLAEPEIQMLMHADRVDVQKLTAELSALSAQLRKNAPRRSFPDSTSTRRPRRSAPNGVKYRAGVGIVLLNRQGQVFVARRADIKGDAWQMPQGGINKGEKPRDAALRELREEIGTNDAEFIAESKGWFRYDVPPDIAHKAWGGKWRGQRQKWFVMVFTGQDLAIDLATEHPEFDAWRWTSLEDVAALVAPFKRQLYVDVMGEFATVFRD
jgi:putative (di)nucleoside polyphosphate hydrolase